jgi:hypothetical protein
VVEHLPGSMRSGVQTPILPKKKKEISNNELKK